MGSHTMPDGERPRRTAVLSQALKTRLGVPDWALRLSRVMYPPRPLELSGAVIPLDTTVWQQVARTSRTPAFRTALVAALSVAWIGTATLSGSSERQPPPALDGQTEQTDGPPSRTVRRVPSADAPVNPTPPDAAQVDVSEEFLRNYAKIAAELDQQAGLGEVSVNPEPAPPPAPCPTCTDPLAPVPEQTLNAPQATADPSASPPPTPTAVEEPSPATTVPPSSQPVPAETVQPTTELPATTNQPVPAATQQPATEPPVTEPPVTAPPVAPSGSGPAPGPVS